jgi:hypothetical protein
VSVVELLAMVAQAQAGSTRSTTRITTGKTRPFLARVLLRPAMEFPAPGQAITHLVAHDCAGWAIPVYMHEIPVTPNVPVKVSCPANTRLVSLILQCRLS